VSGALLTLSHSSRRTNLARCSADFLTRRFGAPDRLRDLPPFESLPPPEPLYSGAVSLWRVEVDGAGGVALRPLGAVRDREKIQHAVPLGGTDLLVAYEQRVERWRLPAPISPISARRAELPRIDRAACAPRSIVGRWEHPWLAGLHTVAPLPGDRALLACSASDALLVLDLASGAVERAFRMPAALYGRNYELTPAMDLRRHSIGDEQQSTHVNAAHPFDGGRRAVVSTLIQGAIGVFDLATGAYEELARGFVGCHGARVSAAGEVYFADSPAGHLVFLDAAGRVARRFDAGSRWLHDVQQLAGPLYAFALADANELAVWDVDRGVRLWRRRFLTWPVEGLFPLARRLPAWLGNSTQALGLG